MVFVFDGPVGPDLGQPFPGFAGVVGMAADVVAVLPGGSFVLLASDPDDAPGSWKADGRRFNRGDRDVSPAYPAVASFGLGAKRGRLLVSASAYSRAVGWLSFNCRR